MAKSPSVIFLALLLFGPMGQAQLPQGTAELACQPDSFSAGLRNQRLHLDGGLRVPTPGYSYQLSQGSRSEETQQFHLVLYPPKGPAPSVIGSVEIEGKFEIPAPIQKIEIAIEKDFNWGPDRIVCEKEGKE